MHDVVEGLGTQWRMHDVVEGLSIQWRIHFQMYSGTRRTQIHRTQIRAASARAASAATYIVIFVIVGRIIARHITMDIQQCGPVPGLQQCGSLVSLQVSLHESIVIIQDGL